MSNSIIQTDEKMNYAQIQMSPKYRHWTIGAKECYSRGGVCQGCETYELIGKECKMKAAVISLVKHCGLPPDEIDTRERENIINDKKPRSKIKERKEEKMIKINANSNKVYDADIDYSYGKSFASIIEAIKKGLITNKEIAEMSGIDAKLIGVKYRDFYRTLTSKNLTDNLRGNTYLEKIIDFVQKRLNGKEALNPFLNKDIRKDMERINSLQHDEYDIEVSVVPKTQPSTTIIHSADRLKELEDENAELKKRIEELENQPKQTFDFDKIRHQIMSEIDKLNAKLQAIELLERELTDE